MITALTWVPRGAARARPVRYELSSDEYGRIKELARIEEQLEKEVDVEEGGDEIRDAPLGDQPLVETLADEEVNISDLPPELRMDQYDDESDGDRDSEEDAEDAENFSMMEQGDLALALDGESDDEDAEDDEIKASDSLLVVAITEDEYSHLEVQLLAEDGTMFIHHDISLPDFPLCLAWTDCPPFQANGGQLEIGNYIAVGTFNPAIEIWNLDVLDPLEPTAVLGGVLDEKKHSKKGKKGKMQEELRVGSHEDAVMGLSWNKIYRFALASSSADSTVKIWDMTTQQCSHTFTHHKDKAQSVLWHPAEAWLLASGSFDKSIALLDCRSGARSASYSIPSDIECLAWDPFNAFNLYGSLEDGQVICVDVRVPSAPLFIFQAHEKTTSGISFSSGVPGLFATASIDKTVKIWDAQGVQEYAATVAASASGSTGKKKAAKGISGASAKGFSPKCVAYKTMNVGKLFAMQFFADDPFVLATAGDKGMVAVWESDESETIKRHFEGRVADKTGSVYSSLSNVGATSVANEGMAVDAIAGAAAPECSTECSTAMDEDDSWMDATEPTQPTKNDKEKKKNKNKKNKNKNP